VQSKISKSMKSGSVWMCPHQIAKTASVLFGVEAVVKRFFA
jgi:hypothetical protein